MVVVVVSDINTKGIQFIVLYPPKCSHDLSSRSKHCHINARYPFISWVDWGNME